MIRIMRDKLIPEIAKQLNNENYLITGSCVLFLANIMDKGIYGDIDVVGEKSNTKYIKGLSVDCRDNDKTKFKVEIYQNVKCVSMRETLIYKLIHYKKLNLSKDKKDIEFLIHNNIFSKYNIYINDYLNL